MYCGSSTPSDCLTDQIDSTLLELEYASVKHTADTTESLMVPYVRPTSFLPKESEWAISNSKRRLAVAERSRKLSSIPKAPDLARLYTTSSYSVLCTWDLYTERRITMFDDC
ncbi:hypothetical protein MPTK1_8g08860 [Marchantia polymorpha subsp. ruderalis]|uniref:Uncharacterized protein n=1 Tax=Marchantia polymorpha TaxID=3197 RepID=A0A2R6WRN0_MARPO|nr:hypothetical protein MARPO_0063s0032 [Marchantia polymorpha]BBN19227.1 hypothetical protein Mp_8g08860 [Marchantia polymorpha subsp. ruderalis]|eukprot:PTQ36484.1 hypothetical protein MARPO_0063s0032 [Marchantia polymorpha]